VTLVSELTVAQKQMVEIAKAVSHNSDVLIMDEPTSPSPSARSSISSPSSATCAPGAPGIVYITHKMNELFEIADEFTVFRDGKYVGTHAAADVTRDDIIRMMVGREITDMFPKVDCPIGEVVLEVENLTLPGVFEDISFSVRRARFWGWRGWSARNARTWPRRFSASIPPPRARSASTARPSQINSPRAAMDHGIAFLTEDRKETGCFLILTVWKTSRWR
jgi:inositol transport system ATP-binding protein